MKNQSGSRIYISGPITGIENNNRDAFAEAEKHITSKGYEAVNPLTLGEEYKKSVSFEPSWYDYMKVCIKALMDCDAICVLDDHYNSRGAMIEIELAVKLKIPEYFIT